MNALPFYKNRLAKARMAMIEMETEMAKIRAIFPKILTALESGQCSPDSSVEFLEAIPHEVALVLKKLKRERDKAILHLQYANERIYRVLPKYLEAKEQRDALAEALQEMRYGHTDKAEEMAIEALNYLTK